MLDTIITLNIGEILILGAGKTIKHNLGVQLLLLGALQKH